MKGITEKSMRDIGIYWEQSRDEKLVMMVFNKDNIIQYGRILALNCTPTEFIIDTQGGHFHGNKK